MRYCGLCEAELKLLKSKLVEDLGVSKPRFRCPVDMSVWEGWGHNLHYDKVSVKAICFEWDGDSDNKEEIKKFLSTAISAGWKII